MRDKARAASIWRSSSFADNVRLIEWDLLKAGLDLSGVDLVVHSAALRMISDCDKSGYLDHQSMTLNLVNAARRAAVPRFIYISSQAVYGVANTPPFHEHSQIDPSTGYSQSKLAGELIVRTLQEGSTDWMILRLSRLYGFAANIR